MLSIDNLTSFCNVLQDIQEKNESLNLLKLIDEKNMIDENKSNLGNTKRTRNPFTKEEDELLLNLVKKIGVRCKSSWHLVSLAINNRSARQFRERYNLFIGRTTRKREKWSHEEDELLLYQFSIIGPQWKKMENIFKGRTLYDIKNRYYSIIRRKKYKSNKNDLSKEDKNISETNSQLNQQNCSDLNCSCLDNKKTNNVSNNTEKESNDEFIDFLNYNSDEINDPYNDDEDILDLIFNNDNQNNFFKKLF